MCGFVTRRGNATRLQNTVGFCFWTRRKCSLRLRWPEMINFKASDDVMVPRRKSDRMRDKILGRSQIGLTLPPSLLHANCKLPFFHGWGRQLLIPAHPPWKFSQHTLDPHALVSQAASYHNPYAAILTIRPHRAHLAAGPPRSFSALRASVSTCTACSR
jgi:hypothetical protein